MLMPTPTPTYTHVVDRSLPGSLTIEAVQAKRGGLHWALSFVLAAMTSADYDDDPHRVIVRNAQGREIVLQGFPTWRGASRGANAFQAELRELLPAAWCDRYGISREFLSG